jgi:hypothetical protein
MKQMKLEMAPAYSVRQWVAERLEGFWIRQEARNTRRRRRSAAVYYRRLEARRDEGGKFQCAK